MTFRIEKIGDNFEASIALATTHVVSIKRCATAREASEELRRLVAATTDHRIASLLHRVNKTREFASAQASI